MNFDYSPSPTNHQNIPANNVSIHPSPVNLPNSPFLPPAPLPSNPLSQPIQPVISQPSPLLTPIQPTPLSSPPILPSTPSPMNVTSPPMNSSMMNNSSPANSSSLPNNMNNNGNNNNGMMTLDPTFMKVFNQLLANERYKEAADCKTQIELLSEINKKTPLHQHAKFEQNFVVSLQLREEIEALQKKLFNQQTVEKWTLPPPPSHLTYSEMQKLLEAEAGKPIVLFALFLLYYYYYYYYYSN